MKLCISNIAWTENQNNEILPFLERESVLLETTKARSAFHPNSAAMQSIVYPNENIPNALQLAGQYAKDFFIKTLVLGAPKHKNAVSANDWVPILRQFANNYPKVFLAIEAVAPIYGGIALSSLMEVQNLIVAVQCYNIGICFDTENFRLSGYDMLPTLPNSIKHIHIAPKFHKEEWDWDYIKKCLAALRHSSALSTDIISIEMFDKDPFTIYKTIKDAKKELKLWLT